MSPDCAARTGNAYVPSFQYLENLLGRLTGFGDTATSPYDPPLEFQIGRGDGTILVKSENAPPVPILGVAGFSDILRKDGSWRVLNVVSADEKYRVQVSYSMAMRDEAAFELALASVLPLVLIGPLLILMIYLSIRAGLRPLERLAGAGRAKERGESRAACSGQGAGGSRAPGRCVEPASGPPRCNAGERAALHFGRGA